MCTTCSHDVVVGLGGSVVVLEVLVVLVDVVDVVVDVVDELVEVVGSVDGGGTSVVAKTADDDGAGTPAVVAEPSVDWTRSLHAAVASASITIAPAARRLI